jgi:hypothetical protein
MVMSLKPTSPVVCVGLVLVLVFACEADDPAIAKAPGGWPQWHGPNRDGKSPDRGLLKSWPAEGPKLLWKLANMGQGYSTVSIGGGLIYTTGRKQASNPGTPPPEKGIVDDHPGKRLFMIAIDMQGKVVWDRNITEAFWGHHVYHGSRATPTYDNGNLYLLSGLGVLG